MQLFGSIERLEAIRHYFSLCEKFDNVWGKPIPELMSERIEIVEDNHMSYKDDEIELYFSITFCEGIDFWYIVKKVFINGVKSNRKGLKRFIN